MVTNQMLLNYADNAYITHPAVLDYGMTTTSLCLNVKSTDNDTLTLAQQKAVSKELQLLMLIKLILEIITRRFYSPMNAA